MSPSAVATCLQDFLETSKGQLRFPPCSFQDRHGDQRKSHGGTDFLSPKGVLASEGQSAVGSFMMKSCWCG